MTIEIPKWIVYAELYLIMASATAFLLFVLVKSMIAVIKQRRMWWCFTFLITRKSQGVKDWTDIQFYTLANELREENEEMFQRARSRFNAWDPPT